MQKRQLIETANNLVASLKEIPCVKGCSLYGSLVKDTADQYSDIDLEIELSGADPGEFVLQLPALLSDSMKILYADYAPSLAPEKYVVSIGLDQTNPFLIADLCCKGGARLSAVTKEQLKAHNDPYVHILKLWIANCKHERRGNECLQEIRHMASKLGKMQPQSAEEHLENVLCWLEQHVPPHLTTLVENCRDIFEKTKGTV